MKVNDIKNLPSLRMINSAGNLRNEISGIFACDLLSHVMGHAQKNNVLITVLSNVNVLGVASLLDLSCVIFSHNTVVDEHIIKKADELNIPLFITSKSTSEITLDLHSFGV